MNEATPKKKLPWWAILLIAFGVLSLIGVAAIGAVVWWAASNKDRILAEGKETMQEAQAYAQTHEQHECVDEGLRRLAKCSGIMCEANTKVFVSACIQQAESTAGFCDGVPPKGKILETSRWCVAECQRRGRGNDQRCARLVQAVPEACHAQRAPR